MLYIYKNNPNGMARNSQIWERHNGRRGTLVPVVDWDRGHSKVGGSEERRSTVVWGQTGIEVVVVCL